MRYLDTGSGDATHCLGQWLTDNLVEDAQSFRCQMGYYGYRALYLFEDILREMAESGRQVHLVLGSNHACLIQSHLEWTMEILSGGEQANTSLTVVAYKNAEFHPKTIHISHADDSNVAIVGSANMTENGLGLNVEASISLDSAQGDDPEVVQQIANAIDRWRTFDGDGVFHVEDSDDIVALKEAQIIDEPQPRRPNAGALDPQGDNEGISNDLRAGTRTKLWRPMRRPSPGPSVTAPQTSIAQGNPPLRPRNGGTRNTIVARMTPMRWCKELKSSDAQWVEAGTSPTGKLRLSKAHHSIDHRRFFRYQMFGHLPWASQMRRFKGQLRPFEEVAVRFDVTIRGNHLFEYDLVVDHAMHREADQNNVPTVLAWGSEINAILGLESHIGDWVVIERDANGVFKLTIQQNKPAWAP